MDRLLARVAKSALHDTSSRPNDYTSECHPNTRKLLLKQLLESDMFLKHFIQWFWGPAGAGKTAIMRSFAKELVAKGNFLAGFYFWRSDNARNNLKAFFPTLAVQLAKNDPSTRPFIERAMQEDDLLLDSSYATQMEKLLITPLIAAHHDHPDRPHPRFIVIDGLDECDSEDQYEFLESLLPTLTSRLSELSVTIFISSRPESVIENGFSHPRLGGFVNRTCLEPSREDVRLFLEDEFEEINRCHPGLKSEDGGRWPTGGDLGILEDKSSGYFILVKTAMRHLKPANLRGRTPVRRLREVLEVLRVDVLAPLDALYLYILRQNAPEDPTELAEWKETVGLICIPVQSSFSTWTSAFGDDAFRVLYGKSRTEVEQITRDLGSIFYVDKRGQPHNYHASFPDCLFNPERSAEFAIDPQLLHERIACAIIGSLNSAHISDENDTLIFHYRYTKVGEYSAILEKGLLPHVELSPKIVAGGRFETTIANVHFGQLLFLSRKCWSTFTLAAVMWKSLLDLFDHPAFESLSHCRAPVTLRLRAFFHHFLEGLQFEVAFDHVSLIDLLGDFFGARVYFKLSLKRGHLCWDTWGPKRRLESSHETTRRLFVSPSVRKTAADLGVPMLQCLSRFFNGDFVHRNPSLFLREIALVADWRSLDGSKRTSYRTFLILYSAPDQAMLSRLWGLRNSELDLMERDILHYFERVRSTILAASLQYFSLCRQAGIRPEGLSEDLEATWLHLSGVALVPPGHVTILDSFPRPPPELLDAEGLALDRSLSVYLATLGESKSIPSLPADPSPADAATSSNEPLTSLDRQLLPPSTASAGDYLIFGEEFLEPVTLADVDGTVMILGCETMATSEEILKAADCPTEDPSQPISSPTIPPSADPLIEDPVPLSKERLFVTGMTDRDSVVGSDVIIEVVGAKPEGSHSFLLFLKSVPMWAVAFTLGLAIANLRSWVVS